MDSIFRRLWDGSNPLLLPNSDKDRQKYADISRAFNFSRNTPAGTSWQSWGMEEWARFLLLNGSYNIASLPLAIIWTKQQYGIVCSTAQSANNHIHTPHFLQSPNLWPQGTSWRCWRGCWCGQPRRSRGTRLEVVGWCWLSWWTN